MKTRKGQIGVGILGISATIILALLGGYFANISKTDSKIEEVKTQIEQVKIDNAVTKADVISIKSDLNEIKMDVKQILKKR